MATRERDAPRDNRTAISCRRCVDLASNSPAMFVQVMSSTSVTPPNSSHNEWPTLPIVGCFERGHIDADRPVGVWILLAQLRLHRGEIGARLIDGDAGLEAADARVPGVRSRERDT